MRVPGKSKWGAAGTSSPRNKQVLAQVGIMGGAEGGLFQEVEARQEEGGTRRLKDSQGSDSRLDLRREVAWVRDPE